jgi:hypothetical protein
MDAWMQKILSRISGFTYLYTTGKVIISKDGIDIRRMLEDREVMDDLRRGYDHAKGV